MTRIGISLTTGLALTLTLGCRTVETGLEDRPWWHATIAHGAVPWPLPTGGTLSPSTGEFATELQMVDYHNAHGAGWWDAPWVFAEQGLLLPSYFLWSVGETTYTELLGGGYEYDPDQWQWRAVNWTMGPPYAVFSSVNYGLVWCVDTVGHDPVAALIRARRAW